MIGVEHIEAWRGLQVLDPAGEQLGRLEEIFFDSGSGTPVLISVTSGLLGRRSTLIPIDGATFGRDYVRVVHAKETVERAGESSRDARSDRDVLSALGAAYGLKFSDQIELESADHMAARNAEAQAARQRAAELAATAQEKLVQRDAAGERAAGASAEAVQAQVEAERARQAALDARKQAQRYDRGQSR